MADRSIGGRWEGMPCQKAMDGIDPAEREGFAWQYGCDVINQGWLCARLLPGRVYATPVSRGVCGDTWSASRALWMTAQWMSGCGPRCGHAGATEKYLKNDIPDCVSAIADR